MYSSNPQGTYVKIYDSNFVQNVGVMIFTLANNMLVSCSKFINNSAPIMMVFATDSNKLAIGIFGYNIFINNNEPIMQTWDPESIMNISHSTFIGNNAPLSIVVTNGKVTTCVDHNRFTDNIGGIILTWNGSTVDIAHSEFIDNRNVGLFSLSSRLISFSTSTLILFYGDQISVSHCEFINNRIYLGTIFIPYYVQLIILLFNLQRIHLLATDVFIWSVCKPGLTSSLGS